MTAVPVELVSTTMRIRRADPRQVAALADSIALVGLLNPITVRPTTIYQSGQPRDGFDLIAGLHRLEACRKLGWETIPATVVEMDDMRRLLAECDENLCSTVLTPAERAEFTRKRKLAYEALHPETRLGENQHTRVRKLCEPTSDRFTADTAARTGKSERAVQLDARRGERIAPEVLDQIKADPALNKGKVLDVLAATPAAQQQAKLSELAAQAIAPRPKPVPHVPADTAEEAWRAGILKAWNRGARDWRLRLLDDLSDRDGGA